MTDTTENYAALCISILKGVNPERAFAALDNPNRVYRKWIDADIEEVLRLRDTGLKWREVADYFGTTADVLLKMVSYKKKKANKKNKI